ncbi:hypothetical protein WISP_24841 [Willisornis vidua]|uniref:Uncharacterized protein n=1 Tax=Willisornis vidua TaxID=1566151 RepID=A0ABQ9DS48_9PASS|nr:hypothetical protein WISP_24841 [Willisornis vidua]
MGKPVQGCPALPCPVQSCHALSWPVLSYPVLSCPVQSCLALSSPVLPCPVLSCPVQSCQRHVGGHSITGSSMLKETFNMVLSNQQPSTAPVAPEPPNHITQLPWDTSKSGDSTTSPRNLFQCLTI